MAGLAVKKSAGRRWIWWISTGLMLSALFLDVSAEDILHNRPVLHPRIVLIRH
jgi:hypothetical protein